MALCWYSHPIDPERGRCKSGHPYRTEKNKPIRNPKRQNPAGSVPVGEFETHKPDGSADYCRFSATAWGYDDYRAFIRSKGQDPDQVTFTWGWTSNPNGGFWNKLNNVRPKPAPPEAEPEPPTELVHRIEAFTPDAAKLEPSARSSSSLVIIPTDLQLGKVDWNGGTKDTLEQVLESFHKAADIAREARPAEIVMIDAGDIVENIYNTSSQLATNDTDLPHQVERAMHIMLTGIQLLAPLAPSFRYAAVSSNHGAHRFGPKQPAGDVHADYGIVVAKMLGRALKLNEAAFGHVTVQTPDPYMESLVFETSGSRIGVVHSHQAASADKIGEWWKGQSHGNMPTADARILIAGHWHSLRVQQSGDARWIIIGPSSDRGSSWYTNTKGESSASGMLSFLTADNQWSELRIL